MLSDFGFSLQGTRLESVPTWYQDHFYRSPKVMFQMPIDQAVDIWNFGCLAWELVEGDHLFCEREIYEGKHERLARTISVLGLPPRYYIERQEMAKSKYKKHDFFDEDGECIKPDVVY